MFENQTALSPENVEKLAQGVGLELARFRQDRDAESTADKVARDRKQGETLNLASTPSLFINGRHFVDSGEPPIDLDEWVRLELALKGQPVPPAASASAPAAAAPSASAAPAASVKVAAPPSGAPPASAAPVTSAAPAASAKRAP
jgi:hypothetical protein